MYALSEYKKRVGNTRGIVYMLVYYMVLLLIYLSQKPKRLIIDITHFWFYQASWKTHCSLLSVQVMKWLTQAKGSPSSEDVEMHAQFFTLLSQRKLAITKKAKKNKQTKSFCHLIQFCLPEIMQDLEILSHPVVQIIKHHPNFYNKR